MKITIKAVEPKHIQNNYITSINNLHFYIFGQKDSIILGRHQPQNKKLQNNKKQHMQLQKLHAVQHPSISRKHAKIKVCPFYKKITNQIQKQQLPSWYYRLQGIWRQLPQYSLINIRKYCKPTNAVLITDLDSKNGLFKQTKYVRLLKQKQTNNKIGQHQSNDSTHIVKINKNKNKKQSIVIQLGNKSIQIERVKFNLSKNELIQQQQQICRTIQNVKVVLKPVSHFNHQIQQYNIIVVRQQYPQNYKNICAHLLIYPIQPISTIGNMIKNKSKNNKFIIGRHPNSDVQINDYSISRKQAYIYADEEGNWVIQDAGSVNGLWVKCSKLLYKIQDFINMKLPNKQGCKQNNNRMSTEEILRYLQDTNIQNANSSFQQQQLANSQQNVVKSQLSEKSINFKIGQVKIIAKIFQDQHNTSKQNCQQQVGQKTYQKILDNIY